MRETVDSLVAYIGVAGWPDLVNGTFEMAGGLFIILSIIKLYDDKKVRGISCLAVGFFAVWGYWNLYYYSHLDQWWSWYGGVLVVITNTIWLGQMVYYEIKERRLKKLWREERSGSRWKASDNYPSSW